MYEALSYYCYVCVLIQVVHQAVYLPLNVGSLKTSGLKPSAAGTRVRVYNAPDHRWWLGLITEYDSKQNMFLVTQVSLYICTLYH